MDTPTFVSINPEYDRQIAKMYKLDRRYSDLLAKHERVWDTEDEYSDKGARIKERQELKEEALYQRLLEMAEELPSRELKNFDSQYKAIHGYESYAMPYAYFGINRWG